MVELRVPIDGRDLAKVLLVPLGRMLPLDARRCGLGLEKPDVERFNAGFRIVPLFCGREDTLATRASVIGREGFKSGDRFPPVSIHSRCMIVFLVAH